MSIGYSKFEAQLIKIELLLKAAQSTANPGRWLYRHDLRTPMFMLEGLCRIYSTLKPEKKLKKLNDRFKNLEDHLGALDYYLSFEKEFSSNKNIPPAIKKCIRHERINCEQNLNTLLADDQWLNKKRIKKIRRALSEIIWIENENKEVELLKQDYIAELKTVIRFARSTRFHLRQVESQLHELRRRIRWLSIYPQAIGGVIVLREKKPVKSFLKKYLTPDIVSSPYNQLPVSQEIKAHFYLEKNSFLALSWTISALGKLKDQGLRILILEEAFTKTQLIPKSKVAAEVKMILGNEYPEITALLDRASKICKTFFVEKNLERLVIE